MSIKKKILIVEDEEALRNILRDRLEAAGLETCLATNGEEGLVLAEKERPDLFLLDILMPKMDGISMLQRLRQLEWSKSTPAIFLSNLKDNDHVAKAVIDGAAQSYIVKADWQIEDVVKKIQQWLEN